MTSFQVQVMDVFHARLAAVPEFYNSLKPSGIAPGERIRWKSTFNEIIAASGSTDGDLIRPYALFTTDPFGATINTEGDSDSPLYEFSVILYLERDADDFAETEAGGLFPVGSDQAMFRAFLDWSGTIADVIMAASDKSTPFLRYSSMGFSISPERTEITERETEDDFFYVAYNFRVGTNE